MKLKRASDAAAKEAKIRKRNAEYVPKTSGRSPDCSMFNIY